MKRIFALIIVFSIIFSSLAYAAGDKNRGSKGKGNTGTTGKGTVTQTRGNG